MKNIDTKKLILLGLVYLVVQFLLTTHLFVTFPEMTAYAASNSSIEQIYKQLNRIEEKVDKLILGTK